MTAFARQCLLIAASLVVGGAALASSGGKITPAVPGLPATGERMVSHRMAGIALDGFDPVAFFDRSRPIAGKPEHEFQHDGATWRFASQANLDAFIATPDVYLPLFGGHDPLSVASGRAVAGLPWHFAVMDGRLVVFSTAEARERFMAAPDMLAIATAKWPDVERQLAR